MQFSIFPLSRLDSRTVTLAIDVERLSQTVSEGKQLATRNLQVANASLTRLEGHLVSVGSDIFRIVTKVGENAAAISEVRQVAFRESQALTASTSRLESRLATVATYLNSVSNRMM